MTKPDRQIQPSEVMMRICDIFEEKGFQLPNMCYQSGGRGSICFWIRPKADCRISELRRAIIELFRCAGYEVRSVAEIRNNLLILVSKPLLNVF